MNSDILYAEFIFNGNSIIKDENYSYNLQYVGDEFPYVIEVITDNAYLGEGYITNVEEIETEVAISYLIFPNSIFEYLTDKNFLYDNNVVLSECKKAFEYYGDRVFQYLSFLNIEECELA